jgi:hypothetical protein
MNLVTKYDAKMTSLNGRYPLVKTPISVKTSGIVEVEKFMNHKLPNDYLEFVLKYGGFAGGAYTYFPIEPYEGIDEGIMGIFFGINHPADSDILEACKAYKGRVPSHLLPIADDPGCNLVCLSLDGPDKGYVYFWDMSQDSGEDPPDTSNLHLIAKSFDEFIESLRHEEA